MLTRYLAAAAIGAALMAVPALAQNTPQTSSQPQAKPGPQTSSQPQAKPGTSSQMPAQTGTASAAGLWQASKLVGLDVYNQQNEKIGDVTELMLDKSGAIDSVVIGVGGFLGMGQHDVAVKFSDLKFANEPVRSSGASPAATTTGAASREKANTASSANPTYPDHAILANATKEQLKAMPAFEYNK